MREISNTVTHTLRVDPGKNRVYCTMTGSDFPDKSRFVQDWEHAAQLVSAGFTVVLDASCFQGITLEWIETLSAAQDLLRQAGLSAIAEIVPRSVFAMLGYYQLRADDTQKRFINQHEAEVWLDQVNPRAG